MKLYEIMNNCISINTNEGVKQYGVGEMLELPDHIAEAYKDMLRLVDDAPKAAKKPGKSKSEADEAEF